MCLHIKNIHARNSRARSVKLTNIRLTVFSICHIFKLLGQRANTVCCIPFTSVLWHTDPMLNVHCTSTSECTKKLAPPSWSFSFLFITMTQIAWKKFHLHFCRVNKALQLLCVTQFSQRQKVLLFLCTLCPRGNPDWVNYIIQTIWMWNNQHTWPNSSFLCNHNYTKTTQLYSIAPYEYCSQIIKG